MVKIKEDSSNKGPREIVEDVSRQAGGIVGAIASGQLPRDEKQISNVKRRTQQGTMDSVADELFVVMQRAYAQDTTNKFIQDIKMAPEPAIVLADDQQLVDLQRFCTSSLDFGVLTVDPTFSLGDFDVTPITYRHLLLETRRGGQTPVFLGPILVHYKKTFDSCLFFASSLIGQNKQLEGVRAIGTDGERPLIDAFMHEFGFAEHLTCFIHVRRNIKDKLNECAIPSELTATILREIFGQRLGSVFQEGLVDSSDTEDYDNKLQHMVESWRNSEMPSTSDIDKFVNWFMTNKAEVIRNTMLRPVREECGLGNPPSIFTTNASESINALLKRKLDYKKQELPVFIEKVKELVSEQRQDVERALVNRGKLQLRCQYQALGVREGDWFTMNSQQRKQHLDKLHSITVMNTHDPEKATSSEANEPLNLPVDAVTVSACTNLPLTCVEGMWMKAIKLLQEENAVVPAPGQSDEARMVLSSSSKTPHMVVPTKGGGFSCDSNCPNWKSMGLCAHSVAVAHSNGKLQEFVNFVKKKKKVPNVTALVTTTMPKGRGRKGGAPPRKKHSSQPAESCTRVAMNVGTQVVSDVRSVGTAAVMYPHAPSFPASLPPPPQPPAPPQHPPQASPFQYCVQPYYSNPSGVHFSPGPTRDPWNYNPWSFPPYSQSYSPADDVNPFSLCFIKGNISVCIGCKNRYPKNAQPPDDLCIRHQEWREFTPSGSEIAQSKFSNVYYHCKPQCVWLRCTNFVPAQLDTSEIKDQLANTHKEYLALHFGIYV